MHVFFYYLEKLPHCNIHGSYGSGAPSFTDTKALFVYMLHRNWSCSYIIERALFPSFYNPVYQELLARTIYKLISHTSA